MSACATLPGLPSCTGAVLSSSRIARVHDMDVQQLPSALHLQQQQPGEQPLQPQLQQQRAALPGSCSHKPQETTQHAEPGVCSSTDSKLSRIWLSWHSCLHEGTKAASSRDLPTQSLDSSNPKPAISKEPAEKPAVVASCTAEAASSSSTSSSTSPGDAVLTTHYSRSIYDLFSIRRRCLMLAVVASAAALAPLADTVYIPSLYNIRLDFRTTAELTALTVSIYMLAVGFAALVLGPASDRYGRRPILLASTVAFLVFTLGCYFSPDIYVLIAFRGLQGAAVSSYGSTGNGVLADTWPPHQRGRALGYSTIPLLIGPLLGPVLGGGLAQAFGWRSTFLSLLVIAGGIILPLLFFGVPESLHHKTLARLKTKDPQAAAAILEAPSIQSATPRFQAPWYPIVLLLDKYVILHALATLTTFGSMFTSITTLPIVLAQPPYHLTTGLIGVACLSTSVAGVVAAPLGGRLADYSVAIHGASAHPLQRLLYNNTLNLVLKPIGLLLYGWSCQYKLNLALLLVGMFLIGVSNNLYIPAVFSFVTSYKQQAAAAAAAGIHAVMCIASGVLIVFGALAVETMGFGPFFTMLASLNFVITLVAGIQIFKCSGVGSWEQLRQFNSFNMAQTLKDVEALQAARMHSDSNCQQQSPHG